MSKRLIINADGFGFTFGNNRGILETLGTGLIKSISTNVNFPAVEEIHIVAEKYPHVSIGIHLNLTVGKPVSKPSAISSLLDRDGNFLGPSEFMKKLALRKVQRDHINVELEAQFEKLLSKNIKISHWDSHQNQHLNPGFLFPAIKMATRHEVFRMRTHRHFLLTAQANRRSKVMLHYLLNPQRYLLHQLSSFLNLLARGKGMRMADRILSPGRIDNMRKFHRETWENLFRTLPDGVSEIYCHPAYSDDDLRKHAKYVEEREHERVLLSDPTLKKFAESCNVELINFNDI